MLLIFSAAIPVCLSLILTPIVIRFAIMVGAVDKPDERKIHKKPMPRLGGVAAFLSFMITLIAVHIIMPQARLDLFVAQSSWLIVVISISVILILGICDDIWALKPGQKFLVQFIAGALVYLAGFRINSITDPFSDGVRYFGILSFPLTVLWVVGITNAFNLIDGLDGLAGGIAVIAGLTISAISLLHHDITTAVIAVTLVGAVLGFLRYNFNPAKVFLGDSGSLFIGFTLAVLSIQSSTKGSTAFSVIVPLLALGVPIMDTSLAMLRRILRAFLPDQSLPVSSLRKLHSMFLPDRRHIHHQLLAQGLSHREAVLVLYVVSCAFGICAFLVNAGSLSSSLILVGVAIGAVVAVKKLGYREMALLRNGLLLRLYRKAFVKHVVSQALLDIISIIAAFLLASSLTSQVDNTSDAWRTRAFAMIMIATFQLLAFLLEGMYRRTINLLGLGDLLQMLKASFAGAIVAGVVLWFLPEVHNSASFGTFMLLDFYFLATFVIGSRVAFHVMNYIFNREAGSGRKALIYGADNNGLITLQSLLSTKSLWKSESSRAVPIGFLDDDPKMEGKFLNGYPVFGGHWKLEGLINKMGINEIVFANTNISTAAFQRIAKIAEEHNVPIKIHRMKLETIGEETRDVGLTVRSRTDSIVNNRIEPSFAQKAKVSPTNEQRLAPKAA